MDEIKGRDIIKALRGKWILHSVLADALVATAVAILMGSLVNIFLGWSVWYGISYGCIVFFGLLFIHRVWRVKEEGLVQLLDKTYPQLQESAALLLQDTSSLNTLEQLQYRKTNQALLATQAPLSLSRKLIVPFFILVGAVMASVAVIIISPQLHQQKNIEYYETTDKTVKKDLVLPQVAQIRIAITPPPYTARPLRSQSTFSVVAEAGASVNWQLQTNRAAARVKFIFNDTLQIVMHATDAAHTQWKLERTIDSTGFYQLSIDGQVSELHKIEVIPDKSPVVEISSPPQYSTIEFGEPQQVKIHSALSDDYGIKEAYLAATIASGSGEAVKFKEQKIPLQGFTAGRREYHLQQMLSLQALGMQPGDELYFYVQATDNHLQQTRSDIHIVHLPDTAQLMSLEGLGNSLTVKPDYFRSQRQIIIETEQLLKDRDTISQEAFKNKSNDLGIDQKLLRLRYGKFLGDESSGETTGAESLGDMADFSNAAKVLDAFTDKHDNSEDATYLDPETKKQLRATLNQMWIAELHLRTYTPKEALPFEYKALRLLKDLQQKSRAYVAKTSLKTTPLDLNKRLTGDVSKIDQTQLQKNIVQDPDLQQPVRNALSALENMNTRNFNGISLQVLQQANLRLHEKAVHQPALYLDAVEAMKRIITHMAADKHVRVSDILTAEYGLQQLLTKPARLPAAATDQSKQALSKQYFDNLQNRP